MNVLCITATKNRHSHLEKLVRCFLEQDYKGEHTLLIYNNAEQVQTLTDDIPEEKNIILVNNHLHSQTGKPYDNVGSIYNDILRIVDKLELKPDLVNHMDDDDFFLSNHIREGVEGYKRGGKLSYKPIKSYYRQGSRTTLAVNFLEPSIFVDYNFLKHNGYWDRNVDLHHKWLLTLERNHQIYVDNNGKPTFVYDWGSSIPTFRTSGNPTHPNNFNNYAKFSQDIGDQVVTPIPLDEYHKYINSFNIK